MIKNLFDWYTQKTESLKMGANDVINGGMFWCTNYFSVDTYIFEGIQFLLKKPHTAKFKETENNLIFINKKVDRELAIRDNELATMSELISEKKYRAYKFLSAKHFSLPVGREFMIMSPNMFFNEVEAADLDGLDKNAEFFEPSSITKNDEIFKHALNTSSYNLKRILKKKEQFLKFMTLHCYNQLVNYYLMSTFEFTDDEGNNNLMFAKNKGSDKFENIFVFDKESTLFNFLLAQGESLDSIKQKICDLDEFCDTVLGGGTIRTRIKTLRDLFEKGLLDSSHKNLLNSTLSVNYDKLADEVSIETGIKKNNDQIDLYKLGQDYTDEFLREL